MAFGSFGWLDDAKTRKDPHAVVTNDIRIDWNGDYQGGYEYLYGMELDDREWSFGFVHSKNKSGIEVNVWIWRGFGLMSSLRSDICYFVTGFLLVGVIRI